MRGNALAAAIGAIGGNAEKGLMVLEGIPADVVSQAQAMLASGNVSQSVIEDVPGMWVKVVVHGNGHTGTCILAHKHDRVEKIEKDGNTIFEAPAMAATGPDPMHEAVSSMSMQELWNTAESIDRDVAQELLKGA